MNHPGIPLWAAGPWCSVLAATTAIVHPSRAVGTGIAGWKWA